MILTGSNFDTEVSNGSKVSILSRPERFRITGTSTVDLYARS